MFTWIDFLIIIVILLYGLGGYRQGFLRMSADILGIVISFIIALKYYPFVGELFVGWGVNANMAKPIGFFALWTVMQIVFWSLAILIFHYIPTMFHEKKVNKYLGIIPGLFKGVMIVGIFLIVLMTLPLSAKAKDQISNSSTAGELVKLAAKIENQMETVMGQLNNTLTFTGTTNGAHGESDKLNFSTDTFEIDEADEIKMLEMVNQERRKNGLLSLKLDTLIRNVARAHSMDMVRNGYFAHENFSGQTPADRMNMAKVIFSLAGENLALAPSIDLAHIGLMNSQKHRENILDPQFGRIGIGVIDAGPYGLMITQDFAD